MPRLALLAFTSLLLCTACPSDDGGETDTNAGTDDVGSETATDTTDGETGTDTETDTGPTCGVEAGVCCAELEECQTDEDCCEPDTFTCVLEAASTKCVDLAKMCQECLTNCMSQGVPADVCTSSCALWCDA